MLPWTGPPTEGDRCHSIVGNSGSRQVQNMQEEMLATILERLDSFEGTGRSAAQQPKRDQLPRNSNSVECFNCHAMGHYARNCPQKRPRLNVEPSHNVKTSEGRGQNGSGNKVDLNFKGPAPVAGRRSN